MIVLWSVVIPIYNGEKDIRRLTDQLAKQQNGQMEAVFVDDGSTDKTYELCRELAGQYDWIRLIHTENRGVSHARNMGIENARGKWIHFIDVDDEIHPEMFLKFRQSAENRDVQAVICGCEREMIHSHETVYCGPQK